MFTGIIEETGTIKKVRITGKSGSITIKAKTVLENTKIGDSIAVNGVCLTVTNIMQDAFTADIMAETVRRSSFSKLTVGDEVNLERAMSADGRFGGHMVSGHIDGTGQIVKYQNEENAIWLTINANECILDLIVEKGSICIDGISLTVASVGYEDFKVSIIPHTASKTTLIRKQIGDIVNLENDIVGKYIQKLLSGRAKSINDESKKESSLTFEMLSELGF